jgi:hypothetical protein
LILLSLSYCAEHINQGIRESDQESITPDSLDDQDELGQHLWSWCILFYFHALRRQTDPPREFTLCERDIRLCGIWNTEFERLSAFDEKFERRPLSRLRLGTDGP